jgi:Ca-activated chloride channel family protein
MVLAQITNYWWLGVLLLIVAGAAFVFVKRQAKRQKSLLVKNNANANPISHITVIKTALLIAGLTLLLVALWRPQWGQDMQTTQKKGLDIVFTVDVSKSMKALDFSHGRELISRLDATKYVIEDFVDKRKGDRIGLIEFAGESFVASPLTLDHTVFVNFLKNISSDDLGKQGTNLADAIEISIARLEVQSETQEAGKTIVLFSDGDETISSDAKKMANIAKEKGIKIFTVGVGSEEGMPIPEGQDAFGNINYKKYKGETVITALNPEPLKEIAQITGGEYFHAETAGDLKKLSQDLDALPKKISEEENMSPKAEKYFVFAALGMMLMVLGFVLPEYPFFKVKIKN